MADITALEARHSDTEHAGGDADPFEVHLQPNDRDRPAGVVCDAVSGIAKNHLSTQPKEHIMKTITVDGVDYAPVVTPEDSPVRIVILQRGWVVVGYWTQDGENVTITRAKVIRRWGTTAGLGELVDGPTDDTVLDPAGTVRAHILGVVATLDADTDAWSEVL